MRILWWSTPNCQLQLSITFEVNWTKLHKRLELFQLNEKYTRRSRTPESHVNVKTDWYIISFLFFNLIAIYQWMAVSWSLDMINTNIISFLQGKKYLHKNQFTPPTPLPLFLQSPTNVVYAVLINFNFNDSVVLHTLTPSCFLSYEWVCLCRICLHWFSFFASCLFTCFFSATSNHFTLSCTWHVKSMPFRYRLLACTNKCTLCLLHSALRSAAFFLVLFFIFPGYTFHLSHNFIFSIFLDILTVYI